MLATVTDANLLLGHLSVAGLQRGGVHVRPELAADAVEQTVARPLGLSIEEAAEAVHRVADQQMARALRAVTTERGRDLAAHTLLAFGGSGPIHAASLAEAVGIRIVVIPVLAGVLSAVGLLLSAVELGAVEPVGRPLTAEHMAALEARLEDMEARLRERLPGSAVRRTLELAFRGQGYDLAIDAPAPLPDAGVLAADFRSRHLSLYGHAANAPIEVVRARVVVAVPAGANQLARLHGDGLGREPSRPGRFGGAPALVPVVRRPQLEGRRPGPLYVDDLETTTVVPPGWTVELDPHQNLVLSR
jgi:N-methylhydantoinase A